MTTTMTTKKQTQVCRLCDEEKAIDLFEIDNRREGGYTTRCKACKAGLNDKSRTLYSRLKGRAKQGGKPLEVTLKELQSLLAAFDGKCIYCDATEDETGRSHHVDHLIAESKGGRHERSNLVVSCDPCNRQKGNRPFFEFYKRKKDEIGHDNFTALLYYISFMSEQPMIEVFNSFMIDYIHENHGVLSEILSDDIEDEISKIVKQEIETKAS